MPSFEQLRVAFGAFPFPLLLAALAFAGVWILGKGQIRLYDVETHTAPLDVWALALGFAIAHQALSGFTGLPPSDSIDWLPIGLLLIAAVSTAGAWFRLPATVVGAAIGVITLVVLALTLHGFKSYQTSHTLGQRIAVFAALALPLVTGTIALRAIAVRLRLADFFLITGLAGAIGAGVLFNGFHTTKFAQLLGIALAIGGLGFVIGIASGAKRVSTSYASAWVMLWVVLSANAFLGNYQLPPSPPLALLLAMPTVAGVGLLLSSAGDRPIVTRLATYAGALATSAIALALAMPPPASDDEEPGADPDNPYADWG
jgi:hypothetical protein